MDSEGMAAGIINDVLYAFVKGWIKPANLDECNELVDRMQEFMEEYMSVDPYEIFENSDWIYYEEKVF